MLSPCAKYMSRLWIHPSSTSALDSPLYFVIWMRFLPNLIFFTVRWTSSTSIASSSFYIFSTPLKTKGLSSFWFFACGFLLWFCCIGSGSLFSMDINLFCVMASKFSVKESSICCISCRASFAAICFVRVGSLRFNSHCFVATVCWATRALPWRLLMTFALCWPWWHKAIRQITWRRLRAT